MQLKDILNIQNQKPINKTELKTTYNQNND